ncbi:MAG: MCE family protein [Thermoleophilia bacterium]|nr:MCE family protein [Thermoleophilia bacterium]
MNKQAPSIGQLITIAGFALSCFGLLLFVWVAFGGPTPLAASGYHLKMPMTQIGQLAEQSEVSISGVGVGHVTKVELGEGEQAGEAIVTLELDPEFAPVPADTRAILRAKSLLGEAYIELTPGDKRDGMLEDGDELPPAQVAKSVQLDEIFRTFDPVTREAFKRSAIDNSIAVYRRGATINQALGVLPGTLGSVTDVLTVLNEEDKDLSKLIRNTGVVFDALSKRQGQLSGLIRNSNTVFSTTAERRVDLQNFFRIFPTFLRESRATQQRLGDFAAFATPITNKMVPVAEQLSPTFEASAALAPVSKRLYQGLKPIIRKAPKAFPSLRSFLDDDAPRLLARVPDYFAEFNPFLQTASYYRKELAAFLANAAAATNAGISTGDSPNDRFIHYIRAGVNLSPSSATAYPSRLTSSRANPTVASGGNSKVGRLEVFDDANCGAGLNAIIAPWSTLTPIQQAQYASNLRYPYLPEQVETQYDSVITYPFAGQNQTNNVPAPGCTQQAPFEAIGDTSQPDTQYQHVFRDQ